MNDQDSIPQELAGRFRSRLVLKQDVFSTVERGSFTTPGGEVEAVLRRIDLVPWWSYGIARHFLKREARGLAIAGSLGIAPPLLYLGKQALVRGWIDGLPVHIARPEGDLNFFRSARRALRAIHREGLTHNDLAKEQNWLRTPTGYASLTDFQLATHFSRRGRLFRIAAYEDLRHMLKHKRRYVPDALTATEKRILARKAWPTRIWMATGKKVYYWITRGMLNFTDREGSGPRFVNDAPQLTARLKQYDGVSDAVIVAFPDRRTGTGLYAFVEGDSLAETDLVRHLANDPKRITAPERLQVVERLPRTGSGEIRTDILQLVAMNQIDLIDPLLANETEKEVVARIVAGRQNLRDRYAF
ncbi:AMP-binding enzyme [Pseudorhodoplanes sp.]|uniref:AMP-binding enzyme n=1 Tax=Pseudorhodoplanes sp. TaxID=1934341 RepID=UPI002B606C12|nr:serine/threonine protein kinase [Pseudorhodoplanes sp.]HWV54835.1 serine/threonine protein kinase [Pseudorhodoplanes sp.]